MYNYELPKLLYQMQDVEPFIDIHTMGLHYYKHEQTYIDNLNSLLNQNNYDFRYNIGELIYHINDFPKSVQNELLYNLGGILNHNLYWKSINPNKRQKPIGLLKSTLENKYGDLEGFYQEIKKMALSIKGSGYTFLVLDKNLQLELINIPNQQTPLVMGYMPLFTIDMWEHAYYLNYENNKSEYIDNFIKIADFSNAMHIFNNVLNHRNNN